MGKHMDSNEIQAALSNLLGIPEPYVFDYTGETSFGLSDIAFKELAGLVELPEGFDLTDMIRVPNAGEFFLDVRSLVSDERVVVYKAIDVVKNMNIILEPHESKQTTEPAGQFDFFLCMLQGGLALYNDNIVRVLVPAVDSKNCTVIVLNKEFICVNLNSLKHVNKSSDIPDDLDPQHMLGFKPKSGIPKPKQNKYKNRFDITFDDPPDQSN
jgi:hypothetical protein